MVEFVFDLNGEREIGEVRETLEADEVDLAVEESSDLFLEDGAAVCGRDCG